MQSRNLEIGVGLFVAIGVLALVMLAMQVSNVATYSGDDGYTIEAAFDNVGGLKVRAPVTMSGVTVGRVKSITFDDETYQAVVLLGINDAFRKIPTDTFANIYTAGLLGEQYVSLDPGGAEDYIGEGGVITQTQSALVLEQVIGQFLFDKAAGNDAPAATPPPPGPAAPGASPWHDPMGF